jgi:hypothetical protein
MKVLATRASRTDTKVTITTNRLFDVLSYTADELDAGDQFILTFRKGKTIFQTVFTASRGGRTLYGSLPSGFRTPSVGYPVTVKVISAEGLNRDV